jgi:copper chaperone CopZ
MSEKNKGREHMQRRNFLENLTMLGLGAVTSTTLIDARETSRQGGKTETVKYAITGFTCITCAVGLETLLMREKGVVAVKADYPAATAQIQFTPKVMQEQKLRDLIQEMGFSARQV